VVLAGWILTQSRYPVITRYRDKRGTCPMTVLAGETTVPSARQQNEVARSSVNGIGEAAGNQMTYRRRTGL